MTDLALAAAPAQAPAFGSTRRQTQLIFAGLLMGMALASLDHTIVTTALPTITGELGGIDHLSWVVTSYLLATTVSTPLYGKLGDLFGRKRLFLFAIVVFLVGSALCGLAQSMGQLIAFRAVQGLGGGGLIVLAMAIIAEIVPPRERGRYQGYTGAVFGATSLAGPLLGGFITDEVSWRWVFYINVPLGLAALLIALVALPASPRPDKPKVDYAGAALLSAAVTCIVLVTTWGGSQYDWGSPVIVSLALAAIALIGLLLVVEQRADEPMLPLHLFRIPTFRLATSASLILGVAMFGTVTFLPLFLQVVRGASATSSGMLLMPQMLGMLAASVVSGQVISRTGRYKAFPVVGCGIATVMLFLLSTMGPSTSQMTVTVYMVLLGVGFGVTLSTLLVAVQNVVSSKDLGVGTSSVNFFRSTGGAVGVALFGALFNVLLRDRIGTSVAMGEGSTFSAESVRRLPAAARAEYVDAFAGSLTTVFLCVVPLVAVAFVLMCLLREVPLRQH